MRRLLFLLPALLLAACAPIETTAPIPAGSDVRLDGTSILGAWMAVGAPDQAEIDQDIRRGLLTRMLVFNPYGRVTLSGTDQRAGGGSTSFEGRVNGDRVTFNDLPGTARLALRDHNTLVLTDPAGNRTVYRCWR
jgi:hypothetical protein